MSEKVKNKMASGYCLRKRFLCAQIAVKAAHTHADVQQTVVVAQTVPVVVFKANEKFIHSYVVNENQ